MRVEGLMKRNVVTIGDAETCRDAIERMSRASVRHLPVVDGTGAVVGIITDRDVRHWLFAPDILRRAERVPAASLLREAPVRDVMSAPVFSVSPDTEVAEAAARMRAARVGSLVVVDGGRVVGILTEIDLLRHVIDTGTGGGPELDVVVSYP